MINNFLGVLPLVEVILVLVFIIFKKKKKRLIKKMNDTCHECDAENV